MAKRDYYETLGIQRGAGADEIKKAYRKLAMQHHPDRNAGDAAAEQKFKEANEAYDVLKDDQKRAAYDRFGHAAFENGGPGAGGGAQGFDFATGFADIFDEMFGEFGGAAGGRGGRRRPARGSDLRYNMGITLEDAYRGKQARIRVPTSMGCESCKGTGAEGAAAPISCNACDGSGRVRATQGFFTIERTCPNCHGSGQVIEKACRDCGGSGRQQHEKTLDVTIPAGVEDGTRIRLSGEGEAGMRGAPPGDLYIFLNVKPHRIFHREGADIHCRVPIPMTTAALGGSIEVPTVGGGKARVTIPEGAQTGRQFRLKGKGMPVLRTTQHGDMYIEAVVETPVNLSRKQKDMLGEFAKVDGGKRSNSPESEGFFAKVKELWDDLRD